MRSLFSKSGGSHRSVLGVHVTRGDVRAVLVREVETGVTVVDRFHRYRGDADGGDESTEGGSTEGPLPGEEGTDPGISDTDYTIEFGAGSSGGSGSPAGSDSVGGGSSDGGAGGGLGALGEKPGDDQAGLDAGARPDQERARPPFTVQLEEIIAACTQAHGSRFDVVFLTEAWGIDFHRLPVGAEEEAGDELEGESLRARIDRERGEEVEPDRVAFQRLVGRPRSGAEVLALIRRSDDSVVKTIETLRKGRRDGLPGTQGLLGEPTLFAELMCEEGPLPAQGTSAVVRVGSDDTLVLFFEEGELVDQELLKSLSIHDPPDTVCKRILLHQDESGIDEPGQILVLAEGRESAFVDRFAALNPDVRVRSFYGLLAEGMAGLADRDGSEAPALFAQAQAVALEVLVRDGVEDRVNLLPTTLRGRRSPIRLGWHTWAAAVLLFAVTLFLAGRYRTNQQAIDRLRTEIRQYPDGLEMTTEQLQSQIDSLQAVYRDYDRALGALDSLLVDSDRWSRMLAKVVREQDRTPGVWFETWQSDQGDRIELTGYATERDRVVDIATRMNAAVEQITFDEIRSYPVYQFTMSAPLPGGLPRSVKYLRERDTVRVDTSTSTPTES